MSYFYLASPYTRYEGGIEAAHRDICEQAALLVREGVPLFCPIAMTHPIAMHGGLDPLDQDMWLEAERPLMDAACGLIVCMLPGWEDSYGIECEMKHFEKAGKPIYFMQPGVVPEEVLPKRRQIVGLTGHARCGKDTAANTLVARMWTRVAFADALRDVLIALNPVVWEPDVSLREAMRDTRSWDALKKDPSVRQLLQRMGTEAGRNIHGDDCWIRIAKRKVDAAPGNVVITDVRFSNEAEAIRAWGGKVIRIERPGVGPVNGHSSESLDFEPDAVIENSGTIEDLHDQVRALVQDMEAVA